MKSTMMMTTTTMMMMIIIIISIIINTTVLILRKLAVALLKMVTIASMKERCFYFVVLTRLSLTSKGIFFLNYERVHFVHL
jgi:hypothetical protein